MYATHKINVAAKNETKNELKYSVTAQADPHS